MERMNGLKEIWIRYREPLNTFWRRALYIFGILGVVAGIIAEGILPFLKNADISHEMKDGLRIFYGWCFGIASAAKVTTGNQAALEFKKKLEEAEEEPDYCRLADNMEAEINATFTVDYTLAEDSDYPLREFYQSDKEYCKARYDYMQKQYDKIKI